MQERINPPAVEVEKCMYYRGQGGVGVGSNTGYNKLLIPYPLALSFSNSFKVLEY